MTTVVGWAGAKRTSAKRTLRPKRTTRVIRKLRDRKGLCSGAGWPGMPGRRTGGMLPAGGDGMRHGPLGKRRGFGSPLGGASGTGQAQRRPCPLGWAERRMERPTSTEERVQWLMDRAEIAECLVGYAGCIDRRDWAGPQDSNTKDGVMQHGEVSVPRQAGPDL